MSGICLRQSRQFQQFLFLDLMGDYLLNMKDSFRQGSGFIHTEYIHAAKALHGIDVFHHCLLFPHGGAAFGQTGIDDHGEQFRSQTHGHR